LHEENEGPTMNRCPSAEQLRDWLADQLPGADADALEVHVEACAVCQQTLEQLTGNAGLRKVVEPASRGESGGDFLRRLEQTPPTCADLPPGPGREAGAAEAPPAVAGYELLGELGRGGMGVVFKARHQSLDRLVALKVVLSGQFASDQERVRFRTEALAVARLSHPNVVQVFEVGEHQGHPYLALEYVAGDSLDDRLRDGPLQPRPGAELVERLARAIQAAPRQGRRPSRPSTRTSRPRDRAPFLDKSGAFVAQVGKDQEMFVP
jgi:hypothetical protein